jgi:hypothetical protein
MVYILPLQEQISGTNVSSEINTAIVTIDLGTVNTGSILLTSLRAAILWNYYGHAPW